MPLNTVDVVTLPDPVQIELLFATLIASASLCLLIIKMQMGRCAVALAPLFMVHSGRTLIRAGRVLVLLGHKGESWLSVLKRVKDGMYPEPTSGCATCSRRLSITRRKRDVLTKTDGGETLALTGL